MNIDEQINFLTSRCVDFISTDALRKKLDYASKNNKPVCPKAVSFFASNFLDGLSSECV